MSLDGTYSGLKASVADFLNRSDLSAAIPDFVTMATAALSRRLISEGPVRQMLGTWTPTLAAELTNLPSDFMGLRSWYLAGMSNSPAIEFAEPEKIAELKIIRPSQDGDPQLLSIAGNQLQLWPWNNGSYVASINYWQALPALAAPTDTNWLLTAHPDAYLYASLIQSAPYLKDDTRLAVWGQLATTVVDDIVGADKIARFAPSYSAPILSYDPP